MTWRELRTEAPDIARPGAERLDRTRVALLGTLRADGRPRISPIEPFLTRDHLVFGSMSWSPKTEDLDRDPRCVLHSAVTGPDAGEGELKLYGRAREVDSAIRDERPEAWWVGRPDEAAKVFCLEIEEAVFVDWELEQGVMTVRRWSAESGYSEATRSYP